MDGADRSYHECLLQEGPDPAACLNLANALSELGHAEAVVERYHQAVELNPSYAAGWNNLGLELAALGKSDEALNAWQKSIEADPDRRRVQPCDALQQAGRFDESGPLWRAYLRLDSGGEWHDYACACLDPALRGADRRCAASNWSNAEQFGRFPLLGEVTAARHVRGYHAVKKVPSALSQPGIRVSGFSEINETAWVQGGFPCRRSTLCD